MSITDASTKPWFIYIVETTQGRLYTGITTDVVRRISEHQLRKRGAKFFALDAAARLLYVEATQNRSSASRREVEIKRLTRLEKQQLIKFQAPVGL